MFLEGGIIWKTTEFPVSKLCQQFIWLPWQHKSGLVGATEFFELQYNEQKSHEAEIQNSRLFWRNAVMLVGGTMCSISWKWLKPCVDLWKILPASAFGNLNFHNKASKNVYKSQGFDDVAVFFWALIKWENVVKPLWLFSASLCFYWEGFYVCKFFTSRNAKFHWKLWCLHARDFRQQPTWECHCRWSHAALKSCTTSFIQCRILYKTLALVLFFSFLFFFEEEWMLLKYVLTFAQVFT